MEAILAMLVQALIPVFGSLLSYGVYQGTQFLKSKTKSQAAWDALYTVGNLADTVVAELNQTMADGMRKAAADGKLTADDAFTLKNEAIAKVKSQIPAAIAQTAALAVNSLDQWIASRIERAVLESKPGATMSVMR